MSLISLIAGCGGVFRDGQGLWLAGFSKKLGICDAFTMEGWAIFEGIKLAWDLGYKVLLESDARNMVNFLVSHNLQNASLLVSSIGEYLSRDWSISIRYIPRENNRIANVMAKMGLSKSSILRECPDYLRAWLNQDCLGSVSLVV